MMQACTCTLAVGDAIDWWLGLDRVQWSDPTAMLSWTHGLEPWQWASAVVGVTLAGTLSYRRLLGGRAPRAALAVIRAVLLIVVVALLAGPMIVVQDPLTVDDRLFMLVDRSESMMLEDAMPAGSTGTNRQPISRDRALRDALAQQAALFDDPAFNRDRRIEWLGFDETTYPLTNPQVGGVAWDDPAGKATSLRTAIEQVLQRAAGHPIAGIVLMTDGQSTQNTGPHLALRLQQMGVQVFVVPLGGDISRMDVAVRVVEAPPRAFINDDVPVRVWVGHSPSDRAIDPARLRVRLIDANSGVLIDEQPGAAMGEHVVLVGRSDVAQMVDWRVEVQYDAADQAALADPNPRNNQHVVHVQMIDDPIRVLYVEGYPRWQYRYLKNMLLSEKGIISSIMLLSADRGFAQEGDEPITRLPISPQEYALYDVIIFGDVPPDYLGVDQATLLRDHVAVQGAGLLWIGGMYHTPHRYEGSVLADLLPMRRAGGVQPLDQPGPVNMYRWPQAERLKVLQLRDPRSDGTASTWPRQLPVLYWAQGLGPLKQSAEVLAATTPSADEPGAAPLVVRMRFGAGQSIYVATDETWRWRYGRGSRYFGQFWTGLIRMLGHHRLQHDTQGVRLDVPHERVEAGSSVYVSLHVADELLDRRLRRIAVAVYREGDDQQAPIDRFELLPDANADANSLAHGGARYRANWKPRATGRLVLRVIEPALDAFNATHTITVDRFDTEMRQTQPDHARLERLAVQTGGRSIALDDLGSLAAAVQSRARSMSNDQIEPLWNSPLALAIVLILLTVEWIGRKLIRLA